MKNAIRTGFAGMLIMAAQSPADAELITVTGMQVLTHRGENVALPAGDAQYVYLDKSNTMTCPSDNGCSIQIASTVNYSGGQIGMSICTFVDDQPAQPKCQPSWYANVMQLSALQGVPNLTKGKHTVRTAVYGQFANGDVLNNFSLQYMVYAK